MRKDLLNKDMNEIFSQNINWKCLEGKTIMISGATGMIASYIVLYLTFLVELKKFNIKIICVVRNKIKFKKKLKN